MQTNKMAYNLTYKQIQIFLQVVETENLTEAANLLHLTQPAVTKQIKSLEMDVGKKLFYFNGRKSLLTAEGESFLPYAREIQASFKKLLYHLSHENKDYKLNLVVSPIYDEWIIQILKQVKKSHPKLNYNINFTTLDYTALYERYDGDLIIASRDILDKKYYNEKVCNLENSLVCSSDNHELLNNLNIDNIFKQTFITLKLQSLLYEQTIKSVPKNTDISIFSNAQVAKKAIVANLGIGWLPDFILQKEIKDGRLIRIADALKAKGASANDLQKVTMKGFTAYLAYHLDKPINKVMREFIQALFELSTSANLNLSKANI
ncbi:LysR family transcriptional regulator [Cysteiniphilum sp. JM-1]|uniref:LysR family transcriptional regulator n=1 Tax=Cysteiniphilum sp. JM-1 TaxID=2610891 RepID=UPI001247069E|nr:LysR family transcriptional regulator [Cysteiniphilum sp. JM-1]